MRVRIASRAADEWLTSFQSVSSQFTKLNHQFNAASRLAVTKRLIIYVTLCVW